jgi:hypothetical protein
MPIEPPSALHTTEYLPDALKITIPSKKQWLKILFLGFWLIGWAFGEFSVIGILLSDKAFDGPILFIIAWLGGWTIGGGYAIYILLWQLAGSEVIIISQCGITTSRSIFGYGFFPNEYSFEYIKDLRVSTATRSISIFSWSWEKEFYGLSGGCLVFDYGAKTINFGIGIYEAEAKQILAEVQQRYPQYRSREEFA